MRTCVVCGSAFDSPRARIYCTGKCAKRAQRLPRPEGAKPAALRIVPDQPAPDRSPEPAAAERAPVPRADLIGATRTKLEQAHRFEHELGQAAMLMAERLDRVGMMETGAGVAALMKEYRATLAAALEGADMAQVDVLEQIRQSAALKLVQSA